MSEKKERLTAPAGKCQLCQETFSKQAMSRHLKSCIEKAASQETAAVRKAKSADTFLIAVEGRDLPFYWMHLEARANAKLKDIDDLLRDIWLECCGHLSSFTAGGVRYDVLPDDDPWGFGEESSKGMDVKLSDAISPGMKIEYEYDFGTTTELTLKVISRHKNRSLKKAAEILARNEDPQIPCSYCGAVAKEVCSYCIYEGGCWMCKKCRRKHGCEQEAFLPVLNSPRTGMCGYTG